MNNVLTNGNFELSYNYPDLPHRGILTPNATMGLIRNTKTDEKYVFPVDKFISNPDLMEALLSAVASFDKTDLIAEKDKEIDFWKNRMPNIFSEE